MNVYVAGSFAGGPRIKQEAAKLKAYGFNVLSRWFNDDDFIEKAWDKNMGGRVAEAMATGDLYAILNSDLVIVDTIEPSTTGGRYAELGAAIVRGLDRKTTVVHVGPPTNIFETLVHEHYPSWEAFFTHLDRSQK